MSPMSALYQDPSSLLGDASRRQAHQTQWELPLGISIGTGGSSACAREREREPTGMQVCVHMVYYTWMHTHRD